MRNGGICSYSILEENNGKGSSFI